MPPTNPIEPGQNTGFIAKDPVASDWKSGAETGVLETPRVPTGDWRPYLSGGKWQKLMGVAYNGGNGFETDACVSFSGIDCLEAFMNWSVQNGKYSDIALGWLRQQGYFDASGKINLSPRFTAKMSGTTTDGNSLPTVCNSLRHDGVVPNQFWDMPASQIQADIPDAWTIYYMQPPSNLVQTGKEFTGHFDVQYEWIAYPGASLTGAQFLEKLSVAPLQIATAVCAPWNTSDVIQGCGAGTAHATMMNFVEANGDYAIRDHYAPFDKLFSPDYTITYAMRIVCTEKAPVPAPVFHHTFTIQMEQGQSGEEITALQDALKSDGSFPLTVQSTGFFGSITFISVQKYQAKYGIEAVGRVGPKTLAQLNKQFGA